MDNRHNKNDNNNKTANDNSLLKRFSYNNNV